ncbi:arylsulfatase [Pseudomonas cavernae]|uniref:Arylsulfatase n=1 Tax=Pseudomonas cavernae TaxID=2320867 RepID=A0A385Z3C4_9PSED|nr:arylsulfatase [Pseudomonas cavernae]AYC32393.1 arylsulfatase [Pseudomonas cavernae]
MSTAKLLPTVLTGIAAAFSFVALVQVASAQPAAPAAPAAGTVSLPPPDFQFKGNVGRTFQDSDAATFPQITRPPKGAPNIVLVLLDDVGFGQFSVFGGGVPSPSMEKLAAQGLRFNRFHTTALCSPTRAALLTGRDNHVAATGIITELATGYDGYTSMIPKSAGTVAEILRQNGYATAWIGKNHNTPTWETSEVGPFDRWATGLGFDYFYGFNAGDTSQWEPVLYENHSRVPRSSDPNYHLSTDIADKAIAWIGKVKAIDPGRPFFAYVAPAATHAPHHAPKEWIDKFKGKFDEGWDSYREETLARQKKLGVVPANATLTARPKDLPAWDSLNADQKRLYARMMEIFAGYGAHVDHEMGRVLDAVAKLPDADNTLIIYIVGDNGSSAEGGPGGTLNEIAGFNGVLPDWKQNLAVIDELGGPKHFNHFPAGWAHAMDTPFQWTKQVASHFGGTRNPVIISWPARIKDKGGVRSQFHHISDVMPTILETAGIQAPDALNGTPQKPLDGISMLYTFEDAKAPGRRTKQLFEMFVNRGIYQNGWMASSMSFVPWEAERAKLDIDKTKWELYNLNKDFTQANDLAAQHPDKLKALQDLWWAEASRLSVLPLDPRGPERMSDQITGRPSLAAGRKSFVYDTPLVALPEGAAPDLKNKSFTITAEVEIPQEGASGMISTQGGFTAGWAFYLQQGKLVGAHNHIDFDHYRIVSTGTVPAGTVTLAMDFKYDGGGMGKGGTLTLYANGKKIGEGHIEKTTPFKYSTFEGQDIGEDSGTPVELSYTPPFKFPGTINKLVVELKPAAGAQAAK